MTLWNLSLWLNDYARQYPFTYMYCEYIHKILVGLVDTASGNPKNKKEIKKNIKTKARQLQSILAIDITNNLDMVKTLVKKLYKHSKWKNIMVAVSELGEIKLHYDEFILSFTLESDGAIKECRASFAGSDAIDSILLYSKTPDNVFDNTKIFQFDKWMEALKYYHVNIDGEDTLTIDSRYKVSVKEISKDDAILQSYGRIVASYLDIQQSRIYNKYPAPRGEVTPIYNIFLKDIVEVTGALQEDLDIQIENFFKIVTHLVDNFPYKEVTILYTDTRTVTAMFRTTTNEDLLALRHVASISLEADENGYIKSITGKAHGKEEVVLYDRKEGLRPLTNWWKDDKNEKV